MTVVELFDYFCYFLSVLPTFYSKLRKKTKKICFTDFSVWPKEMYLLCGWIACSRNIIYSFGVFWLFLNYFLSIYFVFCICNFLIERLSLGQFFGNSLHCCLDPCHVWLHESKHRILSMEKSYVMIYVYA